jgi:hypothetical protein
LQDLVAHIAKAKDQAIELTWLHKGDSVTRSITPAERPKEMAWNPPTSPTGPGWSPYVDADQLREWIEKMKQGQVQNEPLQFRFFGPGITLDKDAKEFSGKLSISISKENDGPARIKVQRGDDTWELTEDNLNELPEDIRGNVQSLLGKGRQGPQFVVPSMPGVPGVPEIPSDIQRQFEEMNRRMDEKLKELHQLRDEDAPAEDEETVDA